MVLKLLEIVEKLLGQNVALTSKIDVPTDKMAVMVERSLTTERQNEKDVQLLSDRMKSSCNANAVNNCFVIVQK